MPRYFFHCADGSRDPDLKGTELEHDQAAQQAAVAFAGAVLKDQPMLLWEKGAWRVEVTDEENILLFTVVTIAMDAPRPNPSRPTPQQETDMD